MARQARGSSTAARQARGPSAAAKNIVLSGTEEGINKF